MRGLWRCHVLLRKQLCNSRPHKRLTFARRTVRTFAMAPPLNRPNIIRAVSTCTRPLQRGVEKFRCALLRSVFCFDLNFASRFIPFVFQPLFESFCFCDRGWLSEIPAQCFVDPNLSSAGSIPNDRLLTSARSLLDAALFLLTFLRVADAFYFQISVQRTLLEARDRRNAWLELLKRRERTWLRFRERDRCSLRDRKSRRRGR